MTLTVIYTIPASQYTHVVDDGTTQPKLPNSYILNTLKTRTMCEAMVESVDDVINAYYDEKILGVWQVNGLQLGTKYESVVTGQDEYWQDIIEQVVVGEPTYPFNRKSYLTYMKDIIESDDEGVVIATTRPTEVKFYMSFGGWKPKVI